MPITYITSNLVTDGTAITSDANNFDLFVASGALVGSSGNSPLELTGSAHDVIVQGTLSGYFGIQLGDSSQSDYGNRIEVSVGGLVHSTSSGIVVQAGSSVVRNLGTVKADGAGVYFGGAGSGSSVVNAGTIMGNTGVVVDFDTTETVTLLNTGSVLTAAFAYYGGDNVDLVTNRGLMQGDVVLNGGNDRFDNRRGELVDGTVSGGDGDDVFLPGSGDESFDGGAGVDTIDFRGSGELRVSLLDDSGTGRAEGDGYVGIERVLGSRGGADTLLGSNSNNTLVGFGGADSLFGEGGRDILAGGAGKDRLTGGRGDDVFLFAAPSEGGDLVADFGGTPGDNDQFRFSAAGFGGGLAPGALAASQFRSRADNVAQDPDDRFVFRTTDRTLWFDSNGSTEGGLTLVADLQAGATLTAGDVVLI